jgi:prophage DNA circulation protein
MISSEQDEVLALVQSIGPVVLSSATNLSGDSGTALRRAVAMLMSDVNMTDLGAFQLAFGICVDLARACGATLVTMERVRLAAVAYTPQSAPAEMTRDAMVRLTLAQEARIIGVTVFTSRDDVDAAANILNPAFEAAEEETADDLEAGNYMAMITLHGATTAFLADVGRQLPRVIAYSYAQVMPALRMAQRAYGDPTRSPQLISENGVVHPAFMPLQGRMLAV